MDKVYAHDDQVGPFARMEIHSHQVTNGDQTSTVIALSTSWRDAAGNVGGVLAVPEVLLIPLYHKIRVPFRAVLVAVASLDQLMREIHSTGHAFLPGVDLEWEIYLCTVENLKTEIYDLPMDPKYRREILVHPMPKYIWRAKALWAGQPVLDLLIDATDIDHGKFLVRAIEHDPVVGYLLRAVSRVAHLASRPRTHPIWSLLQWFARQPLKPPF